MLIFYVLATLFIACEIANLLLLLASIHAAKREDDHTRANKIIGTFISTIKSSIGIFQSYQIAELNIVIKHGAALGAA